MSEDKRSTKLRITFDAEATPDFLNRAKDISLLVESISAAVHETGLIKYPMPSGNFHIDVFKK